MNRIQKFDGFENQYLFVLPRAFLEQCREDPLFASFRITDVGYFPNAQYHFRERAEGCGEGILLLCSEGRGRYSLRGGPEIAVGPGQAFLLPPEVPHRYAADEKEPWSVYWLHFTGLSALPLCELIGRQPQPLDVDFAHRETAIEAFRRCFALLKNPCQTEEYFAACQYALTAVSSVVLAGKQAAVGLTEKGGRAVQRAIAFMKQNLGRAVTLEEIAAAAGFSASHLSSLFKAATDHAPMDYYLRMKMQSAGKELYFTDRSVKEIAAQFGIFDSCYFSRSFKKVMGMSPLAYRNQVKG